MSTALVQADTQSLAEYEAQRFQPVMTLSMAVQRRELVIQATQKLMKPDVDWGLIPGTKKPCIYQPGADKLCNLFGLVSELKEMEKECDWTGERHAGEPFFYFVYKCILMRNGFPMGEGIGSANSWESKYRYRKAERTCPQCGQPAIIKGKAEYGGGWVCFKNKGGCGAKFRDGDRSIEEQIMGNVANTMIFDVVNTLQKMAVKRAKVAAVLNATSAHEFFTQDIEEMRPAVEEPAAVVPAEVPRNNTAALKTREEITNRITQLKTECVARMGTQPGLQAFDALLKQHGVPTANDFKTHGQARKFISDLDARLQAFRNQPEPKEDRSDWIPDFGSVEEEVNA